MALSYIFEILNITHRYRVFQLHFLSTQPPFVVIVVQKLMLDAAPL